MEEDYSSEKDDQEEDYVEMYEPSLALLDIYMERLTLKKIVRVEKKFESKTTKIVFFYQL